MANNGVTASFPNSTSPGKRPSSRGVEKPNLNCGNLAPTRPVDNAATRREKVKVFMNAFNEVDVLLFYFICSKHLPDHLISKAKLYAAQIKKPTTFINPSTSQGPTSKRGDAATTRQSSFTHASGLALAAEAAGSDNSALKRMQEEHAKEVALVESIRKELKL